MYQIHNYNNKLNEACLGNREGELIMYNIVFTKGNEEIIIDSYTDLSEAKEAKKRYESMPEYRDGFITIENKTKNGTKIY